MNEGYEEILVEKGKTPTDTILKALAIGVTSFLIIAGILFVELRDVLFERPCFALSSAS